MIGLIDVQIDAAVVAICQAQQLLQLLSHHSRSTGRGQDTTEATTAGGDATRQNIRFR